MPLVASPLYLSYRAYQMSVRRLEEERRHAQELVLRLVGSGDAEPAARGVAVGQQPQPAVPGDPGRAVRVDPDLHLGDRVTGVRTLTKVAPNATSTKGANRPATVVPRVEASDEDPVEAP